MYHGMVRSMRRGVTHPLLMSSQIVDGKTEGLVTAIELNARLQVRLLMYPALQLIPSCDAGHSRPPGGELGSGAGPQRKTRGRIEGITSMLKDACV